MPKTDAAEPSSQYATDFELVSGKDDVLMVALGVVFGASLNVLPKAPSGDDGDCATEDCARNPAGPALRKA